ncbi:hypothetical protein HDU85_005918 [Gaertneriomyces sp. JEL0708]|nr:hypothetical protein HDU85_005918 [Gaertneriomyces sp. JEL0708]
MDLHYHVQSELVMSVYDGVGSTHDKSENKNLSMAMMGRLGRPRGGKAPLLGRSQDANDGTDIDVKSDADKFYLNAMNMKAVFDSDFLYSSRKAYLKKRINIMSKLAMPIGIRFIQTMACRSCKRRTINVDSDQQRSADEGQTTVYMCMICGYRDLHPYHVAEDDPSIVNDIQEYVEDSSEDDITDSNIDTSPATSGVVRSTSIRSQLNKRLMSVGSEQMLSRSNSRTPSPSKTRIPPQQTTPFVHDRVPSTESSPNAHRVPRNRTLMSPKGVGAKTPNTKVTKPISIDRTDDASEKPSGFVPIKLSTGDVVDSGTSVVNVKASNLRDMGYTNVAEWCSKPGNVYIGRGQRINVGEGPRYVLEPSGWHNPFKVSEEDNNVEKCMRKYREHITTILSTDPRMREEIETLRGKTLGCWCKPDPCHGDILVELLNTNLYKERE